MRRLTDFAGIVTFLPIMGLDAVGDVIDVNDADFGERVCDYVIRLEDGEDVLASADLLHDAFTGTPSTPAAISDCPAPAPSGVGEQGE